MNRLLFLLTSHPFRSINYSSILSGPLDRTASLAKSLANLLKRLEKNTSRSFRRPSKLSQSRTALIMTLALTLIRTLSSTLSRLLLITVGSIRSIMLKIANARSASVSKVLIRVQERLCLSHQSEEGWSQSRRPTLTGGRSQSADSGLVRLEARKIVPDAAQAGS